MKILITNHQLQEYSGSDVFTAVLVDLLKRQGHDVTVYSRYLGKIALQLISAGIRVIDDLEELIDDDFDIAHVHHNINAVEIRHKFPMLPILFLSHGVLPFFEKPPRIEVNIAAFLAVSEEVRDQLVLSGIDYNKVIIYRNLIDSQKFCQYKPIHHKPVKALVLSNKIDKNHEETIRKACDGLGINCKFVGQSYRIIEQDHLPFEINEADIVFSLGRGVMEAMLCGRIPIVYDYSGGDGMVTPDNFHELKQYNFSGRRYGKQFSVQELKDEIKRYNPSSAVVLRDLAMNEYGAHHRIDDLIKIYNSVIENQCHTVNMDMDLIEYFVLSVREIRKFNDGMNEKAVAKAKGEYIEKLQQGKAWRLLFKYYELRDKLFLKGV